MVVSVDWNSRLDQAIASTLRAHPRELNRALEEIGTTGVAEAKKLARRRANTSTFAGTIEHRVDLDSAEVRVGSTSRAAHLVEDGRGPGKPPPAGLIAQQYRLPIGAAFQLARAIGRSGTTGIKVFHDTRRRVRGDVRKISRKLAREISRLDR